MINKVVLIGAGQMGKHHARVLAQLMREVKVVFVAVIDPKPAKEAQVVASQNKVPIFSDWDELVHSGLEFDTVVVATPTAYHYHYVMRALEAGCHVLVEKPIAANETDALAMMNRANALNRVLMVGQIEWFNPAVQEVISLLRVKQYGEVVSITTRRLGRHPGGRDALVGIAIDLGVHDIYTLLAIADILGYKVRDMHVAGVNTSLTASPAEDDVTMLFPLDGAYFQATVSWLYPWKVREMVVVCSLGTIQVDLIAKSIAVVTVNPKHDPGDPSQPLYTASVQTVTYIAPGNETEPLYAELVAFLDACVSGDGVTPVDTAMSIRALEFALQASREIRTGGSNA